MSEGLKDSTRRGFTAGGALAFLASVLALVLLSQTPGPSVIIYVGVLVLGGGLASILLWRGGPVRPAVVLGIAATGHAIALFGNTVFEDDYFRFIWDGWQILQTGTPYGLPPADFIDDPNIPAAMQGILEWINYPEYPTIYGPALQIVFAVTTFFAGADELGLRIVFAGVSLATTGLLLRRFEADRVALFAWNPLVVAEATLHLHPDMFVGFALVAAVLAGHRHPILAGAFLAIAASVKLVALAAWPILLRLKPSALITAIAVMALLYGAFAIQGWALASIQRKPSPRSGTSIPSSTNCSIYCSARSGDGSRRFSLLAQSWFGCMPARAISIRCHWPRSSGSSCCSHRR